MKRTDNFLLLLLLCSLSIFSCKKAEEPEPEEETQPEGIAIHATDVAAGGLISMTIRPDAKLKNLGAIGSGNNLGPIIQVDGGDVFCIALRSDGTVWAWGRNTHGQLGDSTTVDRSIPVQMHGLSNIISISAGLRHTLALKNDGTVWACGENDGAQLGDSTQTSRSIPVQVKQLTNVIAISAGVNHNLALKSDGTIWHWGGYYGTSNPAQLVPQFQVFGTPGEIIAISAGGSYSLFLKSDGTVWGWGHNTSGQLGTPAGGVGGVAQVPGISNVISIAAGGTHSIALKNDSTVWTWGSNIHGELGDGTTTSRHTPTQISGLTGIKEIDAGMLYHSIAVGYDEKVWTWGWNNGGQLGVSHTTLTERSTPYYVVE
ncbi:MAG: RCC1 repeat- and reductase domain-containing protein [Bacteroidetes bacterium]|nr:RCC1 repeat- and reductase domain-containing protein [Bacteroidota bacterium]